MRYHHVPWDYAAGAEFKGQEVPIGSHILHLADRVEILINKEQEVLGQLPGISATIGKNQENCLCPS